MSERCLQLRTNVFHSAAVRRTVEFAGVDGVARTCPTKLILKTSSNSGVDVLEWIPEISQVPSGSEDSDTLTFASLKPWLAIPRRPLAS
jgi:hypothetical protein